MVSPYLLQLVVYCMDVIRILDEMNSLQAHAGPVGADWPVTPASTLELPNVKRG